MLAAPHALNALHTLTGVVPMLAVARPVDFLVFWVASVGVLIGGFSVVWSRNPVHSALWLVVTLFGVAVLFITLQAHFLAVVQIIVYAGAIVVLFLFVIMLLGVDGREAVEAEGKPFQRQAAYAVAVALLLELLALSRVNFATASPRLPIVQSSLTPVTPGKSNVQQLAEAVFTRYLLAFEVTSVLLVIAVVGAVLLARRVGEGPGSDVDEPEEMLEVSA